MSGTLSVITGATGFLGSHLVYGILRTYPDHRVVCVARPKGEHNARDRVLAALGRATDDNGVTSIDADWPDRITVLSSEHISTDYACTESVQQCAPRWSRVEFWHCAASMSFKDSDHTVVWNTNVEGTRRALRLARQMGADVFNHVSTAYVCGTLNGRIPESTALQPPGFNNVYESSKKQAESLVTEYCNSHDIAYRLIRPSIIIGHSHTYRTSSSTGFYKAVDLLRGAYSNLNGAACKLGRPLQVNLVIDRNANLNLIPVDIVVAEMLDIHDKHDHTWNDVFHVTNEFPLSVADILHGITPIVGFDVTIAEDLPAGVRPTLCEQLLTRGLKHYLCYLKHLQIFDRSNVEKHQADKHQLGYRLDLVRLIKFVDTYIHDGNTARMAAGHAYDTLRHESEGRTVTAVA